MKKKAFSKTAGVLSIIFLTSSLCYAQVPNINDGLGYLISTQNSDGSWCNDSSCDDALPATAEVIKTLTILNLTNTPYYVNAATWLQSQALDTTDNIAERMQALSLVGSDLDLLLSYLDDFQQSWGGYDDYEVNNLDTAVALKALKAVDYTDQATVNSAIIFLMNDQNADGGWGFSQGDESNLYMTTVVSNAIQQFPRTPTTAAAIDKATTHIMTYQNADGMFGDASSSVYQTASAYLAMIGATTDNAVLGLTTDFLKNSQAANGSWDGEALSTSLALRALFYSEDKPSPPQDPTTGAISGIVVDGSSNQPLSGVSVALQGSPDTPTLSGDDGRFTLAHAPWGSGQIQVSSSGYEMATLPVDVIAGTVTDVGAIFLYVNPSTGIVKGILRDAASGQPIDGATITITGSYSGNAITGIDGSFVIAGVTPGSLTITASKDGYYSSMGIGTVATGVTIFSPQMNKLPPSATTGLLTGKVFDNSAHIPIPGATITLSDTVSSSTDIQGTFTIETATPGVYQANISAPGYATQQVQVMIAEGTATNMGTFSLTPLPSNFTTLNGRVTDAVTGEPVGFAEVTAVGTGITTNSSPDGSFTLTNINLLEFTLRATATGYDSNIYTIKTANYGTYSVNIPVSRSVAGNLKITALSLDNNSYDGNSTATFTATLENTGDAEINARLTAQIKDGGHKVMDVFNSQPETISFSPLESKTVSLTWETGRNAPGDYIFALGAFDASSGAILAEQSANFTILPTISLSGAVLNINPQFLNNKSTQELQLSTHLTNRSNIIASFTANYEIRNTTGTLIKSGQLDFEVDPAESFKAEALGSFTYTFDESGGYPVTLTISSGGVVYAQAASAIHVAPSVRIEPEMVITPNAITPLGDKQIRMGILLKALGEAPAVLSARVNETGNTITIAFDRPMADPSGKQAEFSVTANDTPIVVTASVLNAEDSTKIDLILGEPVTGGKAILLNYAAGDIQSYIGESLTSFSNQYVVNTIYGQDGFGFSGTIIAQPLSNEITMTGYNQWPDDFIKGNYGFAGGIYDGENIWMFPLNANMVVKINKDTGAMTGYNQWPAGFVKGANSFASGIFDGQYIWMIPYDANMVVKINKDTGAMTGYNQWPAGFVKGNNSFSGGIFDGQYIWMIPSNADRVVKINKDTGVMMAYDQWPVGFVKGNDAFHGGVYDGLNVWMIPCNADMVVKIDKNTGIMTTFNSWPAGYSSTDLAFLGGVFDGQNIWMIPYYAGMIIKIDKNTGTMTGYNSPLPGGGNGYIGGAFDGKNVWMVPRFPNSVLKIDKDTGVMTGYNQWPAGFNKNEVGFYGGVFDGENIWMVPFTADRIIKLSSTFPPGMSTLELKIKSWIDGRSRINIQDNKIWWTHYEMDKPGLHRWLNYPTYLNDYPWIPVWDNLPQQEGGTSEQFPLSEIGMHLYSPDKIKLKTIQSRFMTSIITKPSSENAYLSVIEFNDNPLGGPDWYESVITFPLNLGNIRVSATIPNVDIAIDQTSFTKTPQNITVDGDNTIIEWRFDTLSVGQLEDLAFNITLENPVAGENRLVSRKLEVVYDGLDGNPVRTELGASYVHVMDSAFAGAINVNKPVYLANENVALNVAVKNLCENNKTIDAKILIEDQNGAFVSEVTTLSGIGLTVGETKSIDNIFFNTGTIFAGDYRVRLVLYDNQVEAGSAVADFRIAATTTDPAYPSSIDSRIATDKISYTANQQVALTSSLIGQSANSVLADLTARFTVINGEGVIIYTESKMIPILAPGQVAEIKTYWNTGSNAAGVYTVRLDIFDGMTMLSETEKTFQIAGTSATGGGLAGTIAAALNPVDKGQYETLIYTVTNNGNEDVNALSMEVLIVDPDNNEPVQNLQETISVSRDTTATGSSLVSTAYLSAKTYIAVLRVYSPAMAQPKTLASTTFAVKESLGVMKSVPNVVNLLVWINRGCKDPNDFSDKEKEACSGRIDLLENILRNATTDYTIVYDKKDFQRELRNPFFSDYLILGDHAPLEDHYDAELRENINAGKGFISSLYLKQGEGGNGAPPPVFGIKYKGVLDGDYHRVDLAVSPISAAGELEAKGKAVRVEAMSGTVVGGWINEQKEEYPAIALNGYGKGRAVYFAIDLYETLNDENFAQLSALMANSIGYAHEQTLTENFHPAQFVPVAIILTSPSSAFDVRLTETYSPDFKIYDPLTIQWAPDNPWITNIHIDPGQTKTILHYIFTPDKAGVYSLVSEVGYMTGGQYNFNRNFTTEIVVAKDRKSAATDIITALYSLAVSSKDKEALKGTVKHIENVRDRTNASDKDMEKNIEDLLQAVDKLTKITSCDVQPVRLMIGSLLLSWEGQLYFTR